MFNAGDPIDLEHIEAYHKKGLRLLYLLQQEQDNYFSVVKQMESMIAGSAHKFSAQETALVMLETINSTINEIVESGEVSEEAMESTNNVVSVCVDNLAIHNNALCQIIRMSGGRGFLHRHSIATSVFSILLAKASGIHSTKLLEKIATGAFLHDIGVAQLDFDPYADNELTSSQQDELTRHPFYSKEMIDAHKNISSDIKEIVLQHHERIDGSGHPNEIVQTFKPAKIVSLTDTFSMHTLKHKGPGKADPEDIFYEMRCEGNKYDKELLDIFEYMLIPGRRKALKKA